MVCYLRKSVSLHLLLSTRLRRKLVPGSLQTTQFRMHHKTIISSPLTLSRDRFQFIFEREEDLLTVLKDRPWSYNHWTMVLERWNPNPPKDFLTSFEVWIHIRNIPVIYYTTDTMYELASKIGKVEEIAYDPKVSHKTEYVRAKITFNTESPALDAKNLIIPSDETVMIHYEYEKVHKKMLPLPQAHA
ncbi:uncharacterized protein At4g02000-like [Brassica napus]|uniref:uncharacterized protein At4g02000-like n=1 Tax=Brassica oleracea var. oleracea TaxID=109376 RepID=UPI0006A6AC35|nr:PREDICTED: uncharacterized protein At4g02000-like [Brassica oleracea var. oleracea]XP_013699902.1 uncharacterized protein At4g02000-like [Brassica napus]